MQIEPDYPNKENWYPVLLQQREQYSSITFLRLIMNNRISLLILATLCCFALQAKVTLPSVYTSHMVLQQNTTITLKGNAKSNSKVSFSGLPGQDVTVKADADGHFTIVFSTPSAGGPYRLSFSDGKKLVLEDVMVGEVWLGSGQSNMEMPIAGWGKVNNYEQEIQAADYPNIRIFQVKKNKSLNKIDNLVSELPHTDGTVATGWQRCSPDVIPEFSALCYFFARRLSTQLNIPIGVINSSWGGTPAESWIRVERMADIMGFQQTVSDMLAVGLDSARIFQNYEKQYEAWHRNASLVDRDASADGQQWTEPAYNDNSWSEMQIPQMFDATILPGFDGVVWFRKQFVIQESWKGDLTLHLGFIDDYDDVYLDGNMIAHGSGYNVHRQYTIPAAMATPGLHTLVVRVLDTGGGGGIYGNVDDVRIDHPKKGSISLSGLWKYRVGCKLDKLPAQPLSPTSPCYPTVLYNAMINPLIDFPMAGVIWYQGCNNVGRARQYESLFQTLVTDWRMQFRHPDMPFYFVQLANYLAESELQPESEWALLREAQTSVLHLPNVGMAGNIDLGEANDIHPKDKQAVAARLANLALRRTYGTDVVCSAPEYDSYTVLDGRIHIKFLIPEDGSSLLPLDNVKGFIVASTDGSWHVAKARVIAPDQVEVWCDDVLVPVAVRYAWADNPICNLRSVDGLPVNPFRTDNR